jgi:hypothetical protein
MLDDHEQACSAKVDLELLSPHVTFSYVHAYIWIKEVICSIRNSRQNYIRRKLRGGEIFGFVGVD